MFCPKFVDTIFKVKKNKNKFYDEKNNQRQILFLVNGSDLNPELLANSRYLLVYETEGIVEIDLISLTG